MNGPFYARPGGGGDLNRSQYLDGIRWPPVAPYQGFFLTKVTGRGYRLCALQWREETLFSAAESIHLRHQFMHGRKPKTVENGRFPEPLPENEEECNEDRVPSAPRSSGRAHHRRF